MIHKCEKCSKSWKCAGDGCGDKTADHSPFCLDCFRTIVERMGQQLVAVQCRICAERRWCQCSRGFEAENLPCPKCGAEAMDAVAA